MHILTVELLYTLCVYARACACERERERKKETEREYVCVMEFNGCRVCTCIVLSV